MTSHEPCVLPCFIQYRKYYGAIPVVLNDVLKASLRIEWLKRGITKTIPSFPSCAARAMLGE